MLENDNGRFVLVIGGSLIADTYVSTDLIPAKLGTELGLQITLVQIKF
jgi:hypothetical protein